MTTRYEVVRAQTRTEAVNSSKFKVGELARVIAVEAVANSDGTYSVFPIVEPIERLTVPHAEDTQARTDETRTEKPTQQSTD